MNKPLEDLKIAGSGTIAGGTYRKVSIAGSGKVTGNIECVDFRIAGSAKVQGKVCCEDFSVAGSIKIEDDVVSKGRVSVAGAAKILANVTAEKISFAGEVNSTGEVNGETVEVRSASSTIKSLVGERVFVGDKKPRRFHRNEVELIEATYVEINSTNAKVIRGDEVVLGPFCKVDLVEYTTSLDVNPKAVVKESKKI